MIQESSADKRQSLYLYTDEGSYEPLARIDRNGNQEQHIYYFHTDLNGMPEELTDANGKILWECSFQLWGKRIHEIEHEPIEQNLRYQGQYLDRETGLHYNTFRYYDPDIGRFTQPDPIGLLGGLNLYQYAPNGLTWIDPFGLMCSNTSFKAAFREAKRRLRIPRNTNTPKPVKVYDNKYENRTVWEYKVDGNKKYIILHEEDKFGRGPHFHTADDLHGDPLQPKVRYNQHGGHIPENMTGITNAKGRK